MGGSKQLSPPAPPGLCAGIPKWGLSRPGPGQHVKVTVAHSRTLLNTCSQPRCPAVMTLSSPDTS